MHKSYQSTLPTTNRLLKKKWDDKYYADHQILVRDAKPMVDTRPPRTYMHLHLKLKKIQLEEERAATIERDNRILLEKMSTIMRTNGRIDNRNNYQGRSLNHEKRRRELLRVAQENSTMIQRIQNRKAETTADDHKRDWTKNADYLENISKYAPDWYQSQKSFRGQTRTSYQTDEHRASSEPRAHSVGPVQDHSSRVAPAVNSNPAVSNRAPSTRSTSVPRERSSNNSVRDKPTTNPTQDRSSNNSAREKTTNNATKDRSSNNSAREKTSNDPTQQSRISTPHQSQNVPPSD